MSDTPTQTIADALLLLSLGNGNEIGKDAAKRLMKLERENTKLRALLSEPYSFFTFGHKALSPWGKALDNWCKRAKPLLEKKKAQP